MRTVLLDAAQNTEYFGLSPFAVLDELDKLCRRESEYAWLQQVAAEGGYHDHAEFRVTLRERLLDLVEDEVRVASGLVEEKSYATLFERYLEHVNHWLNKEKLRNPLTGADENPDEGMMREVEAMLNLPDDVQTLRGSWLNRIAAWAIEHPGEPVDRQVIFASYIRRLRDAIFTERRVQLAQLARNMVLVVREPEALADAKERAEAEAIVAKMVHDFGYTRASAGDSIAVLVRERY
jgi:serine protein kinase